MRRVFVSILLFALAALPAAAQRGGGARGGFRGGGFHGGTGHAIAPGPRGFSHGGYGFRPAGVPIRSMGINHGIVGNYGMYGYGWNGFRGHDHDFDDFHHHRYPYNSYYPYYGYYPYWGWADWGWGWDWDNGSSYDNQQQQQASYNQQLALEGQVQYLQQQLAEMRHDQEVQRDYEESQAAARPAQAAPPSYTAPSSEKPQDNGPPTTLVFRDGKHLEAQNYAIVGNNLWLMADGRMKKYPLSELDREATLKSNEDRGVEFRVPRQ